VLTAILLLLAAVVPVDEAVHYACKGEAQRKQITNPDHGVGYAEHGENLPSGLITGTITRERSERPVPYLNMGKSAEKTDPKVHEWALKSIMLHTGMNMNGPAPDI
jgi:hypothetical protein